MKKRAVAIASCYGITVPVELAVVFFFNLQFTSEEWLVDGLDYIPYPLFFVLGAANFTLSLGLKRFKYIKTSTINSPVLLASSVFIPFVSAFIALFLASDVSQLTGIIVALALFGIIVFSFYFLDAI
ncbi:MAG: hypothetical protein FWF79_09845 [Defluviitaleaceae bacterium]|nr:hypothetical protein [Defluviitaleaceae bacterium]